MNWAPIVVAVVIGVVVVPAVMRLRDLPKVPFVLWPTLAVATAIPAAMAYQLLVPPPPVVTLTLAGIGGKAEFDAPPNHSLLVTGILAEEAEGTDANKTDYSIKLQGEGWFDTANHNVKKKSEGSMDIDDLGDASLRSNSRQSQSKWGEDLQKRFDLPGSGHVKAELTLWNGKAAKAIELALIPSPVPTLALVAVSVALTVVGLWLELRHKAERLGRDIGILTMYAVFLRHSTAPLDALQGVLSAVLPAFLLGEGVPGGIAYLFQRSPKDKKGSKKTTEEPAAN